MGFLDCGRKRGGRMKGWNRIRCKVIAKSKRWAEVRERDGVER